MSAWARGDWQDAELAAEIWMRQNGFPDAHRTPPGPDQGIDVLSGTAVAQVKNRGRSVGAPEVQNLHGVAAAQNRRGLFFSTSGFTSQARTWATSAGIALFTLDVVHQEAQPENPPAHELLRSAPKVAGAPWRPDPARSVRQNRRSLRKELRHAASLRTGVGSKKYLDAVVRFLRPGEDVRVVAKVSKGLGTRFIVVTNRRLLVLRDRMAGVDGVTAELWGVHGVEINDRGTIRFTVDGRRFKFTQLGRRERDAMRRWLSPSPSDA